MAYLAWMRSQHTARAVSSPRQTQMCRHALLMLCVLRPYPCLQPQVAPSPLVSFTTNAASALLLLLLAFWFSSSITWQGLGPGQGPWESLRRPAPGMGIPLDEKSGVLGSLAHSLLFFPCLPWSQPPCSPSHCEDQKPPLWLPVQPAT